MKRVALRIIPNLKVTISTPFDGKLFIKTRQHKGLFLHGVEGWVHERCIHDYYKKNLSPESVVFDVGANIGCHTIPLGLQLTKGRVFSFEPDPGNQVLLFENIVRNELQHRVQVVPYAVSDETGRVVFWRDLVSTATGTITPKGDNAWYPEVMGRPPVKIEVNALTIDSYCAENPDSIPELVKIDVEGAEARVIEGMVGTMAAHHPTIIMDGAKLDAARKLIAAGYELYDLACGTPADIESGSMPYTLLAVHNQGISNSGD